MIPKTQVLPERLFSSAIHSGCLGHWDGTTSNLSEVLISSFCVKCVYRMRLAPPAPVTGRPRPSSLAKRRHAVNRMFLGGANRLDYEAIIIAFYILPGVQGCLCSFFRVQTEHLIAHETRPANPGCRRS